MTSLALAPISPWVPAYAGMTKREALSPHPSRRKQWLASIDLPPQGGKRIDKRAARLTSAPMLIWFLFAAMTAALLAVVLRPLLSAGSPRQGHALSSADVYRAQLAELEVEREAGRLGESEYQAARAEIGRRLIKAADAGEAAPASPRAKKMPALAIVLVIAVPAVALPLYLYLGSPDYPDQPLASRGPEVQGAREIERLTGELEAKLKSGKGDATGWIMLGRIKVQTDDYAAAVDAYSHASALLKAAGQAVPADLSVAIGEAEVGAAQGQVTPLAADPKQPSARFYLALAKVNAGDSKGALADLRALLADTPADAPYRAMLEARIKQLEQSKK
jgi:cytochrome c-type biogenesis protein CcmH